MHFGLNLCDSAMRVVMWWGATLLRNMLVWIVLQIDVCCGFIIHFFAMYAREVVMGG